MTGLLEKDVPGGREPFRNGASCQGVDTADFRREKRIFELMPDFSCLTRQKAYDAFQLTGGFIFREVLPPLCGSCCGIPTAKTRLLAVPSRKVCAVHVCLPLFERLLSTSGRLSLRAGAFFVGVMFNGPASMAGREPGRTCPPGDDYVRRTIARFQRVHR